MNLLLKVYDLLKRVKIWQKIMIGYIIVQHHQLCKAKPSLYS